MASVFPLSPYHLKWADQAGDFYAEEARHLQALAQSSLQDLQSWEKKHGGQSSSHSGTGGVPLLTEIGRAPVGFSFCPASFGKSKIRPAGYVCAIKNVTKVRSVRLARREVEVVYENAAASGGREIVQRVVLPVGADCLSGCEARFAETKEELRVRVGARRRWGS